MTTRHEAVRLSLEDDYTAKAAQAAAVTKVLEKNIQSLGGVSAKQSALTQSVTRDTDRLGSALQRNESALDKYSSRLGLVTKGLFALSPAFAGVAASAVPALTSTANLLGITTAAAGVTAIAVQGVGNAVKALSKAQLEPTVKNIAEAQRQLSDLAPEAAGFVLELNRMIPALKDVRDSAAGGLFPGATEALGELDDAIPRLEQFVGVYGDVVGDLLANSAQDMTGGRWTDFVDFLEGEARPTLTSLGGVVGDLAHGMTELWEAMDPANDDLLGGLAEGAGVFDEWASGLQESDKFAEFLAYVRETGPEVVDTALSIAEAVVAIGTAAAPLSGPVLDGIQALAGAVETIASTPAGGALLGLAATSSLAGLARQGFAGAKSSPVGTGILDTITNVKELAGALKGTAAAEEESAASSSENADEKADLASKVEEAAEKAGELKGANDGVAESDRKATAETTKNAKAQETRTAALRKSAAALGKQGAMLGAVMFASSGAAEKMGLANTATFALTGAMVGGGVGAVAGGLVGAFMDATSVGKGLEDQLDALQNVMGSTSATWDKRVVEIEAANDKWQKQITDDNDVTGFFDFFDDAFSSNSKSLLGWITGADDKTRALGERSKEATKALGQMYINLDLISRKVEGEGNALSGKGGLSFFDDAEWRVGDKDDRTKVFRDNFAEIDTIIQSVTPALERMGLGLDALDDPDLDTDALADMVLYLDSAEGRADSVGRAIASLDGNLMSTAASAEAFGSALSSALEPGMNLSAETDNWIKSIRHLNDDLADNSKTLRGNSDAALQNREAIRSRVAQLQSTLVAQAAAGASSEDLARNLRQQRETLIAAGKAAGIGEKQMRGYLRELGLTPRLVRTRITAQGIEVVSDKVWGLRRAFHQLKSAGNIQAHIRAKGVPKTKADVEELVKKFNLTKGQRTALIKLQEGGAKAKTTDILKLLEKVDKKKAKSEVAVDTSKANSALTAVQNRLDNLRDGYVDVWVTERKRKENADGGLYDHGAGGLRPFADGGYGVDGRYYDRSPKIVAGGANIVWGEQETGWEAYISGKPSQLERNRGIWAEAGRRLGYDVPDTTARSTPSPAQAAPRLSPVRMSPAVVERARTAVSRSAAPLGPLVVTGTLQSKLGPVEIRGIARAEARTAARDELDQQNTWERTQ